MLYYANTLLFKHRYSMFWFFLGVSILPSNFILYGQSNEELIERFYKTETKDSSLFYGKKLLRKAKVEEDINARYTAYALLGSMYEFKFSLQYSDTLIELTKDNSTSFYPGMGYLNKANYYLYNFNFDKAIDQVLKAKHFGDLYDNQFIISECNVVLGMSKIIVGDYDDAITMFHKNIAKSQNDTLQGNYTNYISDVYNLASVYNELKKNDSASYYNAMGKRLAKKTNDSYYLRYFSYNAAITQFYKENYSSSKDSLLHLLPFLKKYNDRINTLESYYYLGKINTIQSNTNEAMYYFSKIDSSFVNSKQFYPKFRDTYYELIKIAAQKDETDLQLEYVNKLLTIDSLIAKDDVYITNKILDEFEIPTLLKEKENLITQLSYESKKAKKNLYWFIPILLVTFIFLAYQFRLRLKYQKRAKNLLNKINNRVDTFKESKEIAVTEHKSLDISDDILKKILANLEKFERNEGYLNSNINLRGLAKKLDSNTKYVSKVINQYKNASFSEYINGLRIKNTINRLQNDSRFKNYTIKAIAEESGFNQAESFTKAFYKITEVKPSYFIKEIKKNSKFTESGDT